MEPQITGKPPFSGGSISRIDIDRMPETPQRGSHHRRAHSETFFRFDDCNNDDDDILFDVDFNLASMDIMNTPSISQDDSRAMTVDSSGKSDESNGGGDKKAATPLSHFRSLSVGSEFFDGYLGGFQAGGAGGGDGDVKIGGEGKGVSQEKRIHHRHSYSMDGTTSSCFEVESAMDSAKKAMPPEKLAELALIDPKRAKRILANRQSAARSKERKIRYTSELERKVQTLQTEATTLSAQVTMLQRDTTGLTAENKELKMRLQAMEQQAQLREALNDTLREEVQRLKIATGQVQPVNGNMFNRGRPPTPFFSSQAQQLGHFNMSQTQQQQLSQQLNMAASASNQQPRGGQVQQGSMDFHQSTRGSHQ